MSEKAGKQLDTESQSLVATPLFAKKIRDLSPDLPRTRMPTKNSKSKLDSFKKLFKSPAVESY
jgi:hypothetical protein